MAPSLNSHSYYTHTHTLITSNVVLSVFSPVDHLVVVIEEVLCNSSIGSIIETKMLNCRRYDYYVTRYFPKLSILWSRHPHTQVRKYVHDFMYCFIHFHLKSVFNLPCWGIPGKTKSWGGGDWRWRRDGIWSCEDKQLFIHFGSFIPENIALLS